MPRRTLIRSLPLLVGICALLGTRDARADRNDLSLINLCDPVNRAGAAPECGWLVRGPGGVITGVMPAAAAQERFRSLMSELGAVLAPQVASPASTIGYSGFQFSADLATTGISSNERYWDGVEGVNPQVRNAGRPTGSLTTIGASVRKGIWLPVPSMEVGAGMVHLLESQIVAYQGYMKLALHEGFQDWPVPSLAGRLALSHMTGSGQVRMDVLSLDLLASKRFGIMGTMSLEPYFGWSQLRIKAKSGRIDLTPGCDGYAALTGQGNAGPQCGAMQIGSPDDLEMGYFQFPDQDAIVRNRFFVGAKIHLAAVHLTAQYARTLPGGSRDKSAVGQGSKDNAAAQDRFTLSAGFDF